ncbi:MAG: 2-oxo-4-hydroxy-4-carboxy-5-ureidoimidazoline decarboxylase [Phenylobacterium sp.]|uniref:2-oxo-4-hydroxy-4-carboxy-5-ureidoimidazoline decarboxylase n=1 Tax=Phenylobacterium sp. TaxID=1871053 RepID=UPI001A597D85|nr:2-oxo-4-hydroxy-4-carboxy-5-ureidoimidazoline decarboxylase [Phenylobacterium sp.]MBL8556792.1 2-oxo-4-hydroxy-4-carboxy-5-ureidoimidazoline decarboxylase [Phenylobacterium sp.]
MSRKLSRAEFLARFGAVYEASPWVAEGVWPDPPHDREQLAAAMAAVVDAAPREKKLALIRAHPELASRTAMAEASVKEQAGAGLDRCSAEEFAAFRRLNAAYNARFQFPFVYVVKGAERAEILAAFEARLANDLETEFATAIAQIHRIASLRLADLM